MTFGDYEPEDAWDALDPPLDQLRNLARRIALVDRLDPPRGGSPRALFGAIKHRFDRAVSRRGLTDRDWVRLKQIAADLEYVKGRL